MTNLAVACLPRVDASQPIRCDNGIDYVCVSSQAGQDAKTTFSIAVHLFDAPPETSEHIVELLNAEDCQIACAVCGTQADSGSVVILKCELEPACVQDPHRVRIRTRCCSTAPGSDPQPQACPARCEIQVPSGFHPRAVEAEVWLNGQPIVDVDVAAHPPVPAPTHPEPQLNYLAKDYASFRQLILDRLAVTMPDWRERHVSDIGVVLAEVFAYVGDRLSYYQDAVATEAYLGTARQRISVRRHARLVDYRMHEGCSARTLVRIKVSGDTTLKQGDVFFTTEIAGLPPHQAISAVLKDFELPRDWEETAEAFEPIDLPRPCAAQPAAPRQPFYHHSLCGRQAAPPASGAQHIQLYQRHNTIHFWYDKDADQAWLPPGATCAYLCNDPCTLQLKVGDLLVFAEVLGPLTGEKCDANPMHRQAVRLTHVGPCGTHPLRIEWSREDALRQPFCLRARKAVAGCAPVNDITVAWGNIVLVDHGHRVDWEPLGIVAQRPDPGGCSPDALADVATIDAYPFRAVLQRANLVHSAPPQAGDSASDLLIPNLDEALAAVDILELPLPLRAALCCVLENCDDMRKVPAWLADGKQVTFKGEPQFGSFLPTLIEAISGILPRHALGSFDGDPDKAWNQITCLTDDAMRAAIFDALRWYPVYDLLRSAADDRQVVVEIDDLGRAHLRFGDDALGRQPAVESEFFARYRIGGGVRGNIGAERIRHLVIRNDTDASQVCKVTNPLPALGGTNPESTMAVKLRAPTAYRERKQRAIAAEDYAGLVRERFAEQVQSVAVSLEHVGTHWLARVVLDPRANLTESHGDLKQRVRDFLNPLRRLGHRISVAIASRVFLVLDAAACVRPDVLRGPLRRALLDLFSDQELADGSLGLFHPDRLRIGESLYVSDLTIAAMQLPGVENFFINYLARQDQPQVNATGDGLLMLGPGELFAVQPHRVGLTIEVRGGR
ncbi:MAG: hypothetical protein K1X74_16635 [Pirellulales bacterium]|nr:hypothetical protein [Pirellulales bacterium]